LKGGVELTWNISDNGDLELINLTYNWTTQDFSSRNISTLELEGIITLEGIPDSTKSIQISVANNRGESSLSDKVDIQCGYKGCESRSSESLIIGVVSSVLVLSLFIFLLFFIQRCLFKQCFDF
jgi:ATP-dependent Zn protease